MNYPYRYDNPPLQEFFKKLSCLNISRYRVEYFGLFVLLRMAI